MSDQVRPGWDAIDNAIAACYPDQTEPLRFQTRVPYREGGSDPLDAVAVLRASEPRPHWLYVGYGLTDLYDDWDKTPILDEQGRKFSGLGVELTMRVAADDAMDAEAMPPSWPAGLMQKLASHMMSGGEILMPGAMIVTGKPVVTGVETKLTAWAFTKDPELEVLETPQGRVQFVQVVGLTEDEAAKAASVRPSSFLTIFQIVQPKGIIDLGRESVLDNPQFLDLTGAEAEETDSEAN